MKNDIILCGVGGQGTVLASKLMAFAAMNRGLPVKTAETIGMAQRGGSVFSHVRIGDGSSSPLIGRGRADAIIAFEPAEALRQLGFLRPGGSLVVSNRPIVPVSATVGGPAYELDAIMQCLRASVPNMVVVDAAAAERELGSPKCLNVVLLGAAIRSGTLVLGEDDIEGAIHHIVPERFHELNMRALQFAKAE